MNTHPGADSASPSPRLSRAIPRQPGFFIALAVLLLVGTNAPMVCAADTVFGHATLRASRSAQGRESLTLVVRDAALGFPALGSTADPTRGSIGGAFVPGNPGGLLLELMSDTEDAVGAFLAPPILGLWTTSDAAVDRYHFSNRGAPTQNAAIQSISWRSNGSLSINVKQVGFDLAGPLGAVTVRITTGDGSVRACTRFSGADIRTDTAGRYVARQAGGAPADLTDCTNTSMGANPLLATADPLTAPPDNSHISPGSSLYRLTLSHGLARCNDGSPAVLYVRPAPAGSAHANDWLIWLEGGGSCDDPLSCIERWRGVSYSAAKMSSRWTYPAVDANGIFSRVNPANPFREFNVIQGYYCSSDNWSGRRTVDVPADTAPLPAYPAHRIAFRGHDILEAMIEVMRSGAASDVPAVALPAIASDAHVLFSGSSGGGFGAIENADFVRERLARFVPRLQFNALIDARVSPFVERPPLPDDPRVPIQLGRFAATSAFQGAQWDASCLRLHSASGDPEWCADATHVMVHHVTSEMLVNQSLRDQNLSSGGGGYGSVAAWSAAVSDLLADLADRPTWAEEGSALGVPAVYAPNCTNHTTLEGPLFFNIAITPPALAATSLSDQLWSWFTCSPLDPVNGCPVPRLIDGVDGAVTSACS